MAQWTSIYYEPAFQVSDESRKASQRVTDDLLWLHPDANDDTLQLVRDLRLKIPDFSFTVDVDVLGRHRVTVHFGGGEILVDE